MSVTYTDDNSSNSTMQDAFVPRYARSARRRKPVRTWMILAPIGAVALLGGGAVMMFGGTTANEPVAAPEPVLSQPLAAEPAPLESSGLPNNASASLSAPSAAPMVDQTPAAAPAPVVRARPAAPAERRAEPATAPRIEAEPVLEGPQPYIAPATPAVEPTPTPRAPAISVAPLG